VQNVISEFEKYKPVMEAEFRKGVLMADFNDANIIMNSGKISGMIDFG